MKLTQSLSFAIISALSFAPNAIAAQTSAKERWFEIEVILFSQLGDKSILNEDFDVELPPVKLNRKRDLLSQHINPDLSSIKALLPVCGNNYPEPLVKQASILDTEFKVNDLASIDERELTTDEIFDFQQRDQQVLNEGDADFTIDTSYTEQGYEQVKSIDDLFAQVPDENNEIAVPDDIFVSSLTPAQQEQLSKDVAQAKKYFDEKTFNYQYSITQSVCLLPDEIIYKLSSDVEGFNPNYFALDKMPAKVMRYEDLYSTQPYLLNDESLELHDIVLQLKRSKNFKPLLHTAWRQPAINKRRSRPMRLFAGENLAYAYEKSMLAYEKQKAQAERDKADNLTLSLLEETNTLSSTTELAAPIDTITLNPFNAIIATLKESDISTQEALSDITKDNLTEALTPFSPPVAPEIDWSIDGLFNVHLNHYLYITAEFNIADKTLAQHETDLLTNPESQIKSVRFSQNRRVISKEVHYFDHPHMGMIVQIRRYKVPTKPTDTE